MTGQASCFLFPRPSVPQHGHGRAGEEVDLVVRVFHSAQAGFEGGVADMEVVGLESRGDQLLDGVQDADETAVEGVIAGVVRDQGEGGG